MRSSLKRKSHTWLSGFTKDKIIREMLPTFDNLTQFNPRTRLTFMKYGTLKSPTPPPHCVSYIRTTPTPASDSLGRSNDQTLACRRPGGSGRLSGGKCPERGAPGAGHYQISAAPGRGAGGRPVS